MGLIDIGTMVVGGRQVLPTVILDSSGNVISSLGSGGGSGPSGESDDPLWTKSADDPITGQIPVRQTDGTNLEPIGDVPARAKNIIAGDGSRIATYKASITEPVFTDTAAVVAQRPSEVHLGAVGGHATIIRSSTFSFTHATTAYTADFNIGGLIDLGAIMRVNGGTGVWQSLLVKEFGSTQKAPLQFLIFDSAPADTFTDHAAFPTLATASVSACIRQVNVAASDYVTIGGSCFAEIQVGGRVLQAASGSQHLWLAIKTSGTPTYATSTALRWNLGFLLD